ncbi:hypothetical protein KC909_01715 [Candidatus Dojkabacteria bacterium]|uniref:Uncharacterized protein n=1 Tax=Candidatus Dojkabacteria bacterium TaxID=2099670 RepID=A0A955L5K3_9BACT|nr:hypothetical protein [Candidatus Dojkabacteria bacterium]
MSDLAPVRLSVEEMYPTVHGYDWETFAAKRMEFSPAEGIFTDRMIHGYQQIVDKVRTGEANYTDMANLLTVGNDRPVLGVTPLRTLGYFLGQPAERLIDARGLDMHIFFGLRQAYTDATRPILQHAQTLNGEVITGDTHSQVACCAVDALSYIESSFSDADINFYLMHRAAELSRGIHYGVHPFGKPLSNRGLSELSTSLSYIEYAQTKYRQY